MVGIQAARGTRDILPEEVGYWQQIESNARDIFRRFAYREIRTPVFEQTNLFERGIGEATDVVGKEMYTFIDRGDRSLTLRPEGTAGVARAYIEHHLSAMGGIQRLWYSGAMFRYERPQAGRQRQFHQIGVEVLGSADPRADVEVITMAVSLLNTLGIYDLTLALNSVGDGDDRNRYRTALIDYLTPFQSHLDEDSQDRLLRNPLRILDSKNTKTQEIIRHAPSILDYLGAQSRHHFHQVQESLTDLGISYTVNPSLVRGLDYYTHTAFEIQSSHLGSQSTICGGGRYDGLIDQLGGDSTPAVGWAMGMERLVLLLQLQSIPPTKIDFYLASKGQQAERQGIVFAQALRNVGFGVEVDLSGSAFNKQLKRADRSGASACLILGDGESEHQSVQVKWLATGKQETVNQADLLTQVDYWHQRLGENM